ncbi:hypothetical protein Psuf_020950 [Phytohabitans suffuscus]|uniref:Uncharacterized protein n=1 Tax=Phytohabitans suffuscus TaxID=624315 RepID=A0A6F8YFA9_9ACTN|nr:hypothetical protein Psuf_020950 [Phytohabitans suffuscus]
MFCGTFLTVALTASGKGQKQNQPDEAGGHVFAAGRDGGAQRALVRVWPRPRLPGGGQPGDLPLQPAGRDGDRLPCGAAGDLDPGRCPIDPKVDLDQQDGPAGIGAKVLKRGGTFVPL